MRKELEPYPAGRKQARPLQANTLARVLGGFPARIASSWKGGKDRTETPAVTTNQRPSNGGRWGLSGRSFTEKFHAGVFTVGENHRGTGHQDHRNLGGVRRAAGVATHLAMAGRGEIPGPFMVPLLITHNPSFNRTRISAG